MNNNIRTMKFVGEDDWHYEIYKCIETGIIYKNIEMKGLTPKLYTCNNDIYSEPCFPMDTTNIKLNFIEREPQPTEQEKFNYQLLSRLQQDCEYYLNHGNRNAKHLWAKNEQKQINKMKELYNSFTDNKKPEWLTYEQIVQYEKLMINN